MSLAESSSEDPLNAISDLTIAKVIKMPEAGANLLFVKIKSHERHSDDFFVDMKFIDVVCQSDILSFILTALQFIERFLVDLRSRIKNSDQEFCEKLLNNISHSY